MANVRTDIHSPANFDPASYTYVHCVYLGGREDLADMCADVNEGLPDFIFWSEKTGRIYVEGGIVGNFSEKGTCDHCGAWFLYGMLFEHLNGERIVVGHTCSDNAFGCNDRAAYDLKRLQGRAKSFRERANIDSKVNEVLDAHVGLREAFECDHHIVRDIFYKLKRWGNISPKQAATVIKIAKDQSENAKNIEEQEALLVDVVEGRRVLTGKILMTKWYDNEYGGSLKCLLITDDNQKIFGTVPSKIAQGAKRGDTVRFTATVKVKDGDPKFGFYGRPAKAEILEKAEAPAEVG